MSVACDVHICRRYSVQVLPLQMLTREYRVLHALILTLVLRLWSQATVLAQPAPAMQPIHASGSTRYNAVTHEQYLQQQAKEAETAARYQAALRKNSRGAREAARLAALRAKQARPVSVIATLVEGSLLAAWALASPQEGNEAVLALTAVRIGRVEGDSGARQHENALPADVKWLVATGLRAEHTYTVEVNGEEVLTQQSNDTLAAGVALPAGDKHVGGNKNGADMSEWAEGKVGAQVYYYRSAEPEKIFWELPEIALSSRFETDEL